MNAIEIIAIILMVEWAIIHVAAFVGIGIPAWSDDMSSTGVYFAADLLMTDLEYKKEYDNAVHPRMSGKILWQHGYNLGWVGLWSGIAVPVCIAYQNRMAWVMTLVPFLADVGYFVAFDLFQHGGRVAQAQTYIISVGSILTAISVSQHHDDVSDTEFYVSIIVPSCLIFAGILEKLGVMEKLLVCCGVKTRAQYDAMGPRPAGTATTSTELPEVSKGAV